VGVVGSLAQCSRVLYPVMAAQLMCYVMCIVMCYVMLCCVVCCVVLCYAVLCCVVLCVVCCVVMCYVMCCDMLCWLAWQACAYVNGELVLDLVAVLDKDHALSQTYNASSLQNIFSSSKAVASIVVAMLVDRGHLRYDMKVADVWPGE
jgi:hypothetical protein